MSLPIVEKSDTGFKAWPTDAEARRKQLDNTMLDARTRLHGPALLYTDVVFKEWILTFHNLTDDQVDALQIERAELAARPVRYLRTD